MRSILKKTNLVWLFVAFCFIAESILILLQRGALNLDGSTLNFFILLLSFPWFWLMLVFNWYFHFDPMFYFDAAIVNWAMNCVLILIIKMILKKVGNSLNILKLLWAINISILMIGLLLASSVDFRYDFTIIDIITYPWVIPFNYFTYNKFSEIWEPVICVIFAFVMNSIILFVLRKILKKKKESQNQNTTKL